MVAAAVAMGDAVVKDGSIGEANCGETRVVVE